MEVSGSRIPRATSRRKMDILGNSKECVKSSSLCTPVCYCLAWLKYILVFLCLEANRAKRGHTSSPAFVIDKTARSPHGSDATPSIKSIDLAFHWSLPLYLRMHSRSRFSSSRLTNLLSRLRATYCHQDCMGILELSLLLATCQTLDRSSSWGV